MKKRNQLIGVAGLVLLTFGIIGQLLIAQDRFYFVAIHLSLGTLLLIIFMLRGGFRVVSLSSWGQNAGRNLGNLIYSASFIGILVLVNYIAAKKTLFYFDSSEQKVFSLAPQTKKLIDETKSPIEIKAFFRSDTLRDELRQLLKRVSRYSNKISWQQIDPEKMPSVADRYNIRQNGIIIIHPSDESDPAEVRLNRDADEQLIARALLKLNRRSEHIIYYLSGHGEADIQDSSEAGYLFLKEAIEGENISVKQLVLGSQGKIPKNASAILVNAPRRPLLKREREEIIAYLESGGSAIFLHEPNTTDDVPLIVSKFGIEVGNNVIVDEVVSLFEGTSLGLQPMISSFAPHPITRGFSQSIVVSVASSVTPKTKSSSENTRVSELAFTSNKSWAETKLELLFNSEPRAEKESDDLPGPVSIAAAASLKNVESEKKQGRIVVIGDSDFLANINIQQLFNRDFFLNATNWVIGQDNNISIRARTLRETIKPITKKQFNLILLLTGILLPECMLLLGITIWWQRKS